MGKCSLISMVTLAQKNLRYRMFQILLRVFGTCIPWQVQAAASVSVTPSMQNEMRSKQGKNLKRGRKPKNPKQCAKGSKDSKTTLKKRKSKRNIQKETKTKGKGGKAKAPKKDSPTDDGASGSDGKKRKATKPVKSTPETKHTQSRIGDGKQWQYEILPNQVFGCRNCRFIYGGCRTCQKPTFRGLCAAQARLQQQEHKNAEQEIPEDAGEVEVKTPSITAAKKAKRAKKAKSQKN